MSSTTASRPALPITVVIADPHPGRLKNITCRVRPAVVAQFKSESNRMPNERAASDASTAVHTLSSCHTRIRASEEDTHPDLVSKSLPPGRDTVLTSTSKRVPREVARNVVEEASRRPSPKKCGTQLVSIRPAVFVAFPFPTCSSSHAMPWVCPGSLPALAATVFVRPRAPCVSPYR